MSARTVIAYAGTWAPTLDEQHGERRLLRIARTALDAWRKEVRPGEVPVLFGHEVEVGRFTAFTIDETGIRTRAEYHRTALADDLLADMREGVLSAYSIRLSFPAPTWSGGIADSGVRVFDVPSAELIEAGPTYQPHDPFAKIVSVGGEQPADRGLSWPDIDHFLDTMSAVTGVTTKRIRDEARLADWVVAETIDRAESLARTIATASRAAEVAWSFWQRAGDPQDREREFTDYVEANRTVRRCEAELRELLVNDDALIAEVKFGAGPR